MGIALQYSVGSGGRNDEVDVAAVQVALNLIPPQWGGPKTDLGTTGKVNQALFNAIRRFQKHTFGKNASADAKIEPGSKTLKKLNQVLRGEVDLVMLGPPRKKNDNGILSAAKQWENEIPFDGVTNMCDKILEALKADPSWASDVRIKSLTIVSHGMPGIMRTARSDDMEELTLAQLAYPNYTEFQADELAYFTADQLARLKDKFAPQAIISLYACRIAASVEYGANGEYNQPLAKGDKTHLHKVDGRNLLRGVSKALGGRVPVQGSGDAKVRESPSGLGMEGRPIYRCDAHHCAAVTNFDESWWGPEFTEGDEFWDHYQADLRAEMKKAADEPDPGKKKGILARVRDKIRRKR